MELLNSKALLSRAIRRNIQEFELPEIGGKVYLRPLSAAERSRLADAWKGAEGKSVEETTRSIQAPLIIACVVDENGDRIFGAEDTDAVTQMDAVILDKLGTQIMRLSGLATTATGEAEKNSGTGQNGSSSTDSLSLSAGTTSTGSPIN